MLGVTGCFIEEPVKPIERRQGGHKPNEAGLRLERVVFGRVVEDEKAGLFVR